jgi:hypothetical protein
VIGCCLPADERSPTADALNGMPVRGGTDDVADVVALYQVDTVAVLPGRTSTAPPCAGSAGS